MTMTDWEARLRRALADTSEQPPRPMARLELPLNMDKLLLTPALMKSLRPAAVLAPVIRRPGGLTLMFTVRADHLRSHKGQISFPGGRRDEGDASSAANALREAEEEVALPPASVEVIGYLDDYPTMTRYLVTPVVGIVSGEPPIHPCEDEVAEIFEVPLDYVLDLKNFERKLLSNEGLNVPFFEVNWGRHRIWGATAGMLWNFANKVAAV
ncbi:CoA pyrophosphatase [Solimonas sp. K1W22B-7]|uniref:CoA pyrophosphatase n=1 Tax=Solimonas sp. K1W22B-7 TaxID=2303331 RepID=UPI000E3371D8|nr:CoA pyrophosphatase [Solimonas sp. K1W22B-7]AXQ29188.1 CoA pyrophosphatase [Solimonas sp. K1W22B-7]